MSEDYIYMNIYIQTYIYIYMFFFTKLNCSHAFEYQEKGKAQSYYTIPIESLYVFISSVSKDHLDCQNY